MSELDNLVCISRIAFSCLMRGGHHNVGQYIRRGIRDIRGPEVRWNDVPFVWMRIGQSSNTSVKQKQLAKVISNWVTITETKLNAALFSSFLLLTIFLEKKTDRPLYAVVP
ncbi:hypothetical protein RUM44_005965 [Polyplax serrata]|uniref:Uncharacterized protein n=1 Tax=Polyplax serrata TaxID=468196 RepID=A0ABR1AYL0_POLSC